MLLLWYKLTLFNWTVASINRLKYLELDFRAQSLYLESKPFVFTPTSTLHVFFFNLSVSVQANCFPFLAHLFWSIPHSFCFLLLCHPLFYQLPLVYDESHNHQREWEPQQSHWWGGDREGHSSTDRHEKRISVITQSPTSEQDRRRSCEAGSNTNWGIIECPPLPFPPQLTGFPLLYKLSLLSLNNHISLYEFFPCFVPILSSFLSSPQFSGWLGAVWVLTLLTIEGSPWSEVPLFPPAKSTSTEVIHWVSAAPLSWFHTHTTHTGVACRGRRKCRVVQRVSRF